MNDEEKKLLEYLYEQKAKLKQVENELRKRIIPISKKDEYKETKIANKKKIRAFHLTKKENLYFVISFSLFAAFKAFNLYDK